MRTEHAAAVDVARDAGVVVGISEIVQRATAAAVDGASAPVDSRNLKSEGKSGHYAGVTDQILSNEAAHCAIVGPASQLNQTAALQGKKTQYPTQNMR